MKKRNEWIRKHVKREKKKSDRGIVDLMMIVNHFFKDLSKWIDEMTDPRHGSYVTYTQTDLVYMGLLKNMCGVKSMCEMEEQFNEENCIATLLKSFGRTRLLGRYWRIILDGTGLFYFRKKQQSIKNTSSRLLESFRRQTVTDEDVSYTQRYTTVYLE